MYLPSFPNLDLFSAGVNALNGVLVARNPSHNRGYTAAGLLIMALFGGIGGGVSRDLLLNDIPSPIKDPSYIFVCHHGWRHVDRCVLRSYTGSGDAVRTHCHDGGVGGWGLRRNCPARETEHAFLSRHPDRGTGFISLPRVCGAGSLAADRANERPSRKTSGRATGEASAFVSEKKEGRNKKASRAAAIFDIAPCEQNT